ncbi:MAG: helicase-related protein [Candidatus Micrarchaeota archaeon]
MDLEQTALKKGEGAMQARGYQEKIAESVLMRGNSLAIMPTAMGKTFVAAIIIARRLWERRQGQATAGGDGKVAAVGGLVKAKTLFLTPTKPLAVQQARRLEEVIEWEGKKEEIDVEGKKKPLEVGEVVVLSGETAPELRRKVWESAVPRVVCATPQTVEYDLLAGRMRLEEFDFIVFDEVHRAVKEYSYSFIAKEAAKLKNILLLGLTASPSSDRLKIKEICENLGIVNVEIRSEADDDVKQYVNETKVQWAFVDFPKEFEGIRKNLHEMLAEVLAELKELGAIETADLKKHKRQLLEARKKAIAKVNEHDFSGYKIMSLQAKAMNLSHAIDLIESEGLGALHNFITEMRQRKSTSKAVKQLNEDFRTKLIEIKCGEMLKAGMEHPKHRKLKEIVSHAAGDAKSVIVFAHYRNTIQKIVEELNGVAGVMARQFIGRSKEGMSQKKQEQVLQEFRDKKFNVLVSSSVGEEGIDIPTVDLVVFFEAVPSEIRAIQRRGRTGRAKEGKVIVLITKGSKDEAFLWISRRKEQQMRQVIGEIREEQRNKRNKDRDEQENTQNNPISPQNQKSMSDFA